jgi:D-3-phosphoglycerate dehydrogenase / 2-oxoglutarate reductase
MVANRKSVVRPDTWLHAVFDERLAKEPDIESVIWKREAPEADGWAALARGHVYQCSSAKDELPKRWFVTTELLERAPNLVAVSASGAGYDTIDVKACTAAGIAVVNQAGGNANSVAEHAIGLMLGVMKKITECDRRMHAARGWPREDMMGHELSGKTLGIVGIGHVGTRVAKLADAFGMQVLAYDPYVKPEEIGKRGATPVTLDEMLGRADIVTVHCPRAQDTIGMLGAAQFGRMKPGAVLINTARGGIHNEGALHWALKSGHLAGAGLDVWEVEPPPLDHPLLKIETVIATHHTAGVTHEARRNMAGIAAEQIVTLLRGKRPPRLVNPEVWPAYQNRFERILGLRAPA